MDKIFIRAAYLKILHFLFFSMAIFSITSALSLWGSYAKEAVGFLIFSAIYLNATLWLAYFFYKDYKVHLKNVRIVSRYARPYIILCIAVFSMTEAFLFVVPGLDGLIYSIMFINFYYAFVIIIGAVLYLIKPVRRIFDFQTVRGLMKGKEIAMKYSHLTEIANYKIGSNPFIDDVLDDIWGNKEYPVPHVQRLEIELCQTKISEIEERISLADKWGWSEKIKEHLKREKKRYEDKISDVMKYND